jgi:hypothetical protein
VVMPLAASGIKELLDLSPVFSNDVLRADVFAPLQGFQPDSCEFRKLLASFIWHMRIIFGMDDQHFRRRDFRSMVPRIIESPTSQLSQFASERRYPFPNASRMYSA